MLGPGQVGRWAQRFGVADAQIRLDHLLSHVIWAVAELDAAGVLFFGGTALCRTFLTTQPWLRLSEDLDLLLVGDPLEQRARLEDGLPRQLRREFPNRVWEVTPSVARAPTPALLRADGHVVRVQLLPATSGWAAWTRVPASARAVDLRYEDLPDAVTLAVPTAEGFAAMKLSAWEDRRAPRDLFDLAGLTTIEAFTSRTLDVFTALSGRPPELGAYRRVPDATAQGWTRQLAHRPGICPAPRCVCRWSPAPSARSASEGFDCRRSWMPSTEDRIRVGQALRPRALTFTSDDRAAEDRQSGRT